MQTTVAPHEARPVREACPSPLPLPLWGCVGGLMIVELLLLTIRFDMRQLLVASGIIGLIELAPGISTKTVALGGLTASVATLLFGSQGMGRVLARSDLARTGPARPACYLAGQVAAYSAFAGIAATVLEGVEPGRPGPIGWSVAWVVSGVATLGLATAAALPPRLWWPLVRSIPGAIASGIALGIASAACGMATGWLWVPLAEGTMRLSAALLGLVHPVVVCRIDEKILGTPDFTVSIAPACSGYEGIGLALAFLSGFLWFDRSRLRWPRAWLLLPLGVAAIWTLNSARIAALVTLGAWVSPELAAGGFHSQAGSLAFTAVALGLVAAGRSRAFRLGDPATLAVERPINPAASYLVPQLAILATTMVVAAFSTLDGFDRAYPLRVVAAGLAFWWFRGRYRDLAGSWSWASVGAGVLVFAAWMALEPAHPSTPGPMAGMATATAAMWLASRVIGSVVAVPVAEELAFRGFLARRVASAHFEDVSARDLGWLAIALSSAAFGALHGRWLAGCLAGVVYALTYRRRGALIDAVVAHAVTNALIAGYVVATGRWSLWS